MIKINSELCTGCGDCVAVCPHAVLALDKNLKRSKIAAEERCMECGACGLNCPKSAITGNFGVGCFACMTQERLSGKKAAAGACGC
jgi:NAD-dependent dihydropyrimidine dehydrogenase PreA subunit